MNKFKSCVKKAFTIVELVIVIAVIGVLAAILVPTFITIVDQANMVQDQKNAKIITDGSIVSLVTAGNKINKDIDYRIIWTTTKTNSHNSAGKPPSNGGFYSVPSVWVDALKDDGSKDSDEDASAEIVRIELLKAINWWNDAEIAGYEWWMLQFGKAAVSPLGRSQDFIFNINPAKGLYYIPIYGKNNYPNYDKFADTWGEDGIGVNIPHYKNFQTGESSF